MLTHIHTHACVNVCDFAINGSIYVLCFEIALVLIFLGISRVGSRVPREQQQQQTAQETTRGNHINGLNVRE